MCCMCVCLRWGLCVLKCECLTKCVCVWRRERIQSRHFCCQMTVYRVPCCIAFSTAKLHAVTMCHLASCHYVCVCVFTSVFWSCIFQWGSLKYFCCVIMQLNIEDFLLYLSYSVLCSGCRITDLVFRVYPTVIRCSAFLLHCGSVTSPLKVKCPLEVFQKWSSFSGYVSDNVQPFCLAFVCVSQAYWRHMYSSSMSGVVKKNTCTCGCISLLLMTACSIICFS